jgi:hypothetical protein
MTMDSRSYLMDLLCATSALRDAMQLAEHTLPAHVKRQHWEATAAFSLAPWSSVEAWYLTQAHQEEVVKAALTDLKLMADALASLTTAVKPLPDTTVAPNLKLARVRRSA